MKKNEIIDSIKCQLNEIDNAIKHMKIILKTYGKDSHAGFHAYESIKNLNIAKVGLELELETLESVLTNLNNNVY